MHKPVSALIIATILAAVAQPGLGKPQTATATSPPAERPQFAEQELGQLRSPFTKETVLKLNAIVARSKKTIDRFDREVPGIREAIAAAGKSPAGRSKGKTAMARLNGLAIEDQTELHDIKRAEAQVRSSGEKYNDVILSAMVAFVTDVKTEIGEEESKQAKQFAQR